MGKGGCKLNCEKRERFIIDYTMIYHMCTIKYRLYAQMSRVNEMICGRYETPCFDINKWRQPSATRSTAITVEFLFPSRQ